MKFLKHLFFTLLAIPLVLVGAAAPEFSFPKPTGPYAVGTKVCYAVDDSRKDVETDAPRGLVMQVWYPADGKLEKATAPYAAETLAAIKKIFREKCSDEQPLEESLKQFDLFRTYAIADAPILQSPTPYPVIIFAHGYGTTRGEYSSLCEEFASKGYVVLMVMHSYVCQCLHDASLKFELLPDEKLRPREPALLKLCMDDIKFLLKKAQSGELGIPAECCDFKNMGAIGHSLGGMMASHACREFEGIKVGISLDGPLYGDGAMEPFGKPFMFMIASTFYEMFFSDDEGLDVLKNVMGMTKEQFATSLEDFCKANGSGSQKVTLKDAEHCTFADDAILVEFFKKIFKTDDINLCTGTINGFKANEIIRAYVGGFFDKHLKNQDPKIFDDVVAKYPDETTVNVWQ